MLVETATNQQSFREADKDYEVSIDPMGCFHDEPAIERAVLANCYDDTKLNLHIILDAIQFMSALDVHNHNCVYYILSTKGKAGTSHFNAQCVK